MTFKIGRNCLRYVLGSDDLENLTRLVTKG